jgi:hypothetical protein
LIKLETKDYFEMWQNTRASITIDPGAKLKNKKGFSMTRGPIDKYQTFRGQIENSHFHG